MNFKNINSLFLIFFSLFIFSCNSNFDFTKKNLKEVEKNIDIFEQESTIDKGVYHNLDLKKSDYYDELFLDNSIDKDLKKLHTFVNFKNSNKDSQSLLFFIYLNKFISMDKDSNINLYDIDNFKIIKSINLNLDNTDKSIIPTSFARIEDLFFLTYSDGKIISFNIEGEVIWEKKYNNIIKTPIKIYNNKLIILLSDRILYVSPNSGKIIWDFEFKNNKPIRSLGGNMVTMKHLLFFIMPNNEIGEINTVLGELNESVFSEIKLEDSINNASDKIHAYKNYISYFDQNKYLTTINIGKNENLLNKTIIKNTKSSLFHNNTLLILDDNNILKTYNLLNKKLFWSINLSKIIKKNKRMIKTSIYQNSLYLFFDQGLYVNLNLKNGKIINKFDFMINDIVNIKYQNPFFLINQANGKTSIFKR